MNTLVKLLRVVRLFLAVSVASLLVAGNCRGASPVRILPQVAAASAPVPAYWVDPNTRLMWAASDNGSGLSRRQALRYCRASALGGFKDWTLPTIEELQGLFGGDENHGGFHLRAPIKLTGWQWSATAGQQEGEGWAFDFGDGGRASVATGDSGLNRALCVRRP